MFIFMLAMVLLLPISMLIIGITLLKHPILQINSEKGYRTNRAMQSQENWAFAQKMYARLMIIINSVLIFCPTFLIFIFYKTYYKWSLICIAIQLVCIVILPLCIIEKLLKNKKF